MKKKWKILVAMLLFLLVGGVGSVVYAAAPGDENYDDDAGYSNATTQFTIDGLKYTLTGPGPDTLVTNVAPSGWGELGDGGSDNFISIMGIDTLKIEASDGSYFKLNGLEIGFCSVAGITITPSTGTAITRAKVGDESYYSIDVSMNPDFQYIKSFTISGTDMIMNIDDIDFAEAIVPEHAVSYNGNGNTGGSAPTDGSSPYSEGDSVTVLGNSGTLTRTGYVFAGWNTEINGTGTNYAPGDNFTLGTSNVILYAKWEPLRSVTYNGNQNTGGSVPIDGNTYINGDTVTALTNSGTLVRTGYTFAGWNTAADGTGTNRAVSSTFPMGASNVTLYAKWTPIDYSVTYFGNLNIGGTPPIDGSTYHIADTVTVLGNSGTLTRTGYTFAGWNTAADGSGTGYSPASTFAMGNSNVSLYAQWTENTYHVLYDGNLKTGGNVPTDNTNYLNGNSATVLGNTGLLIRTGYTFAGWNTAANGSGTTYQAGEIIPIAMSDRTLYAMWTPVNYSVTYNGNTNTGGAIPVDGTNYHITDTVTVIGNTGTLTKTGYTFAGWNTAANGSGIGYSPASTFAMGSSNVTLYAQWTENTYTITYNGNQKTGGSVPTDATNYHHGDLAPVLGNTGSLIRTGYVFSGWNTAADGSGTFYDDTDSFAIEYDNLTFYAVWTPVNYSVTYNGNTSTSGIIPSDSTNYHITDTVTVLGNPGLLAKTGYTFAGWNTASDGSGSGYSQGNTFAMGSSNVTLYAQWTENTYSIIYNDNNSTGGVKPIDSISYYNGNHPLVIGNIGSLVRTGYTFEGWNTAADGSGTTYLGGDIIAIGTSNITLYAKWNPINYSVTYDGNTNTGGAEPVDGNAYHITNSVTVLGNTGTLTKTGYTFTGWNTAENGSGISYAAGNTFQMGSINVTLYAQWSENTYSVTYDGNANSGGVLPAGYTTYHMGDTHTVLANTGNLVRTGYTFAGWNSAADGSGTDYADGANLTIATSNITLYAKWIPINYSITYQGNANTGGLVPVDSSIYHINHVIVTLSNSGNLTKTGYTFIGWNTKADGSGTAVTPGNTVIMGSSSIVLYAQWKVISIIPSNNTNTNTSNKTTITTSTVTTATAKNLTTKKSKLLIKKNTDELLTKAAVKVVYDANDSKSGSGIVPVAPLIVKEGDTITVTGNNGSLEKEGYVFAGWNTKADGSGITYQVGDTFEVSDEQITLFAQWTPAENSVSENATVSANDSDTTVSADATDEKLQEDNGTITDKNKTPEKNEVTKDKIIKIIVICITLLLSFGILFGFIWKKRQMKID